MVSRARSGSDSTEELRDALLSVGLRVVHPRPDQGVDLVLVNPAGGQIAVEVERVSLASVDGLDRRLIEWGKRHGEAAVRVVVADRVTQDARDVLQSAGWGWLDLRGHVHVAGPGLFVDADVPALKRPTRRSVPLAGRVGVEVAALLLLEPDLPAVVRPVAVRLGRAPSSVSGALSGLLEAGLLDQDRRPVVPDLFDVLADRWKPAAADVASLPGPGQGTVNDALRLGFDGVADGVGWALTDTVAAATYGAPVSVRGDSPRDFYVPDESTLRRAVHLLGPVQERAERAGTIRVAPVPVICSGRVDATTWADEEWPLAQPLFVALDLAQDPGRGREVLDGWTPPERWHRVW